MLTHRDFPYKYKCFLHKGNRFLNFTYLLFPKNSQLKVITLKRWYVLLFLFTVQKLSCSMSLDQSLEGGSPKIDLYHVSNQIFSKRDFYGNKIKTKFNSWSKL